MTLLNRLYNEFIDRPLRAVDVAKSRHLLRPLATKRSPDVVSL